MVQKKIWSTKFGEKKNCSKENILCEKIVKESVKKSVDNITFELRNFGPKLFDLKQNLVDRIIWSKNFTPKNFRQKRFVPEKFWSKENQKLR